MYWKFPIMLIQHQCYTQSQSDWLFNSPSRILLADWLILVNNEKAALNTNMPYWTCRCRTSTYMHSEWLWMLLWRIRQIVLVHIYTKARSFGCLMPMRCVGKSNLRRNVSFLLFRSMTYFYKRQLQITFSRQLKVRSSKFYNCLISLMAASGDTTWRIWYSLLTNRVNVAPGGIGNFILVDIVLWHINSP